MRRMLAPAALIFSSILLAFPLCALAEEDVSDFDGLYQKTAPKEDGDTAAGRVDPGVDEEALAAGRSQRNENLENLNRSPHDDRGYADLSKRKGRWELAPVMAGQKQDGKGTRSDDPTEVIGIGLTRGF